MFFIFISYIIKSCSAAIKNIEVKIVTLYTLENKGASWFYKDPLRCFIKPWGLFETKMF